MQVDKDILVGHFELPELPLENTELRDEESNLEDTSQAHIMMESDKLFEQIPG